MFKRCVQSVHTILCTPYLIFHHTPPPFWKKEVIDYMLNLKKNIFFYQYKFLTVVSYWFWRAAMFNNWDSWQSRWTMVDLIWWPNEKRVAVNCWCAGRAERIGPRVVCISLSVVNKILNVFENTAISLYGVKIRDFTGQPIKRILLPYK